MFQHMKKSSWSAQSNCIYQVYDKIAMKENVNHIPLIKGAFTLARVGVQVRTGGPALRAHTECSHINK